MMMMIIRTVLITITIVNGKCDDNVNRSLDVIVLDTSNNDSVVDNKHLKDCDLKTNTFAEAIKFKIFVGLVPKH